MQAIEHTCHLTRCRDASGELVDPAVRVDHTAACHVVLGVLTRYADDLLTRYLHEVCITLELGGLITASDHAADTHREVGIFQIAVNYTIVVQCI